MFFDVSTVRRSAGYDSDLTYIFGIYAKFFLQLAFQSVINRLVGILLTARKDNV